MFSVFISYFTWPLWTLACYLRFWCGLLLASPVLAWAYVRDPPSLLLHDRLFSLLQGLPLGLYVFAGLIGFFAPYTASISPLVSALTQEECAVQMSDLPWLRNPFNSVHAIALTNLGELASGLPMVVALQHRKDFRGIPVEISTVYKNKARGTMTARSNIRNALAAMKEGKDRQDCELVSHVYDGANALVCTVVVKWRLTKALAKEGKMQ